VSVVPAGFTITRWKLRKAGFVPVPLAGKRPVANGWQNKASVTAEDIYSWEAAYPSATDTGVLTRITPALDIDILDPDAAEAVEGLAREWFGDDGTFAVRFGRPPKRAVLLRTDVPFNKLLSTFTAPDGASHRVELLGDGQQLVVDGVHPDTRKPYRWHGGEPWQFKRADLPLVTEAGAREFIAEAAKLLEGEFDYKTTASAAASAKDNIKAGRPALEWVKVLSEGADEGVRDHTATQVAGHLLRRYVDPRVVLALLQSWNATSCRPPLPDKDILRIVNSIAGKELKRRGH
jgi:Bifunctional DNA primase/polymerase, N-terminal/Primase C terminal 1 (PriCT-1)